MMARSRKKITKAPAKKKASTTTRRTTSADKSIKKSALHKLLTAEGWRRLMMTKRGKSK